MRLDIKEKGIFHIPFNISEVVFILFVKLGHILYKLLNSSCVVQLL